MDVKRYTLDLSSFKKETHRVNFTQSQSSQQAPEQRLGCELPLACCLPPAYLNHSRADCQSHSPATRAGGRGTFKAAMEAVKEKPLLLNGGEAN